ncbi:MAG: iron-sulfur cluster assembly protein, partial [Muribaculaceae bacterium]|nr:iron-sulfur cluster assembly protein [Muribaculaceae bacterium]
METEKDKVTNESEENKASTAAVVENVEKEAEEELRITNRAIEMLRTVYDPEIPVNVYDLGLIYKIDYEKDTKTLHVDMT